MSSEMLRTDLRFLMEDNADRFIEIVGGGRGEGVSKVGV